jgi:hypothetical protein
MYRFMLFVAVILSAVVLAPQSVFAQDTKPANPGAAAIQTKEGTVKSVNAKTKTFILQREPESITFKVTDATVYTVDGKEAKMEDALKLDAKVTVTYTRSGEERIATKVEAAAKKE